MGRAASEQGRPIPPCSNDPPTASVLTWAPRSDMAPEDRSPASQRASILREGECGSCSLRRRVDGLNKRKNAPGRNRTYGRSVCMLCRCCAHARAREFQPGASVRATSRPATWGGPDAAGRHGSPSPASSTLFPRCARTKGDLSVLRLVQRAGPQVLRRVRHPARRRLRALWSRQRRRGEVLRRVRVAPGRGSDEPSASRRAAGTFGPRRGAAAGVDPLRRPRRVHDTFRTPRCGGGARAAVTLLRHQPTAHRTLRRHGGEVHRRRRDGDVGSSGRQRGRRRACGANGARSRRRRQRARRRAGRSGAASSRGRRR
jgi:hypothetical protein